MAQKINVTQIDSATFQPSTTGSAGSGAAANIVQPTIILNKIIKVA